MPHQKLIALTSHWKRVGVDIAHRPCLSMVWQGKRDSSFLSKTAFDKLFGILLCRVSLIDAPRTVFLDPLYVHNLLYHDTMLSFLRKPTCNNISIQINHLASARSITNSGSCRKQIDKTFKLKSSCDVNNSLIFIQ